LEIEHDHATLRIRRTPTPDDALRPHDDAQLIVLVGHTSGRRFQLGDKMEIGRGPSSPIEILDDGVSRQHALVYRAEDASYRIRDLGSRNGTFVNGARIEDEVLAFGDKIALGSRTVLMFAHRDRFEDQRIQAQKLQALGQLAGGIAHDFNNLLGVVLANITHVQRLMELEDGEVKQTLSEVETAARRAVDLTKQLLTFARSGQRGNRPTKVGDLLQDAQRLVARTLSRTINVQCSFEPNLIFVGDASQILQVMMNLCINAGDAMPKGGLLQIHATSRLVTASEIEDTAGLAPGDYVSITVRDTGIGMAPEVCRRVFEPFFTTKPRGKGTGLGLATAAAIVRDHGGSISVDSIPGEGTTFEVLVPLFVGEAVEPPQRQDTLNRLLNATVLLADDEDLIRTAGRRVLEHGGVRVLEAENGRQAVDVFRQNTANIDLVILDLDMPQLDGAGAFSEIRALAAKIPVLISSGYIDHEREEELLTAGVTSILHKPYDSKTLMQAVFESLETD
jgi:signal transduction histidine kinase/CheY-like chemotaxis protein